MASINVTAAYVSTDIDGGSPPPLSGTYQNSSIASPVGLSVTVEVVGSTVTVTGDLYANWHNEDDGFDYNVPHATDSNTAVGAAGPWTLLGETTDGDGYTWYFIQSGTTYQGPPSGDPAVYPPGTDATYLFVVTNNPTPSTQNYGRDAGFFSPPPCFLEGTQVLTRTGYRPVETLQVGDEMLTLNHGWQAVKWLGFKEIIKDQDGNVPFTSQPIRINRNAFGPDLPTRDLWVSPDHAVFFRNHLIPAKSLVNGETVVRDSEVASIKYFHVLLDRHAVVFSEGLPTESYIPQENVQTFENAESCPNELKVGFTAPIGVLADCFPRVTRGAIVETARAALLKNMTPTADRIAA